MNRPDRQHRIDRYRNRLADDPGAKVFAPLADLLRSEGHHEEALEILEKGLARHPEYISGRVILGRTLLESGEVARARTILTGVLETDVENLVVLRLLAEEAVAREAWAEARPHLELLAALDPDRWAQTLVELPPVTGFQDPAGGEHVLPGGESTDPSFATLTLVDIYLAQGYRDKAKEALERILAREPDRKDVAERLAGFDVEAGVAGPAGDLDHSPQEAPAELRERKTVRRSQDKDQFQDWLTRLREDERTAP